MTREEKKMNRLTKRIHSVVSSAIVLMAVSVVSTAYAQEGGQATQNNPAPIRRVAIVGAVANPGTFEYEGNMMMKDVFAAVGGFTKDADHGKIVIVRGGLIDPSKAQRISYDYEKVAEGKASDMLLLPGDVVEVPERRAKRNVLGQVASGIKKLSSVVLDNSAGLLLSTPLLSKAVGKLGSLVGIGDSNDKVINGQMMGIAGPTTIGSRDAANLNRPPTPLEAALVQAIAAESPEVRDRILQRVIAVLQAQNSGR